MCSLISSYLVFVKRRYAPSSTLLLPPLCSLDCKLQLVEHHDFMRDDIPPWNPVPTAVYHEYLANSENYEGGISHLCYSPNVGESSLSYKYKSLLQHCTYNITLHINGASLNKHKVFTAMF